MGKTLKVETLTSSLHLSECTDGFWLYDDTRGMNLVMRAKTKDEAFIESLTYYQNRLLQVEIAYNTLKSQVTVFVDQVASNEDED